MQPPDPPGPPRLSWPPRLAYGLRARPGSHGPAAKQGAPTGGCSPPRSGAWAEAAGAGSPGPPRGAQRGGRLACPWAFPIGAAGQVPVGAGWPEPGSARRLLWTTRGRGAGEAAALRCFGPEPEPGFSAPDPGLRSGLPPRRGSAPGGRPVGGVTASCRRRRPGGRFPDPRGAAWGWGVRKDPRGATSLFPPGLPGSGWNESFRWGCPAGCAPPRLAEPARSPPGARRAARAAGQLERRTRVPSRAPPGLPASRAFSRRPHPGRLGPQGHPDGGCWEKLPG